MRPLDSIRGLENLNYKVIDKELFVLNGRVRRVQHTAFSLDALVKFVKSNWHRLYVLDCSESHSSYSVLRDRSTYTLRYYVDNATHESRIWFTLE